MSFLGFTGAQAAGGGGGTPGGSTGQVQYNNSGAFGGITNLTSNGTNPLLTAIAAPATPAAGFGVFYVDSTNKVLALKNDAGTVSSTVVPSSAAAHQFATAVSAAGVITFTQPAFTDISGTATVSQGGTGAGTFTTNGVLYGNGTGAIQVTAQGPANSVLTANAGAPSFSAAPVIGTSVTTPLIFAGTAVDTSISRTSAGLLQIGTTAANALGNITFTPGGSSPHAHGLLLFEGAGTGVNSTDTVLPGQLLLGQQAFNAPINVLTTTVASGTATTVSASVPTGSTLVLFVTSSNSGSATFTVTDSASNSYTVINNNPGTGFQSLGVAYNTNTTGALTGGTSTVTVTSSSGGNVNIQLWALNGSHSFAGSQTASAASATSVSATITPTLFPCVVFGQVSGGTATTYSNQGDGPGYSGNVNLAGFQGLFALNTTNINAEALFGNYLSSGSLAVTGFQAISSLGLTLVAFQIAASDPKPVTLGGDVIIDPLGNVQVVSSITNNIGSAPAFVVQNTAGAGHSTVLFVDQNGLGQLEVGYTNSGSLPNTCSISALNQQLIIGANNSSITLNPVGTLFLQAGSGSVDITGAAFGYGNPGIADGGTVTQATSKSTGVTLNTYTGQITMNAAALASQTTVSFTLTDSKIAATDFLVVQHISAGTLGAYVVTASCAAGSATINVRNVNTASLSEAIVLKFFLMRAVTN